MRKAKLLTLVLALSLVLGALGSVFAAPKKLATPTELKIEKATAAIASTSIVVGDWYATFTNAESTVTATYYTFEATLKLGTVDHSAKLGAWVKADSKYYSKIDASALLTDSYELAVKMKPEAAYTSECSESSLAKKNFTISIPAAAVGGALLDIEAQQLNFSALAEGKALYYRFGAEVKDGGWKKLETAAGATSVDVSKLITKAGVLEFMVGDAETAPSKLERATTKYKFAAQATWNGDKPKAIDYTVSVGDQAYALIENVSATNAYKRLTDPTSVVATNDFYGGVFKSAAATPFAAGFYYPVGLTATELQIMVPASYSVSTETYTAASKPQKVKIAAQQKALTIKVNYAKNIVQVKDDAVQIQVYTNSGWGAWTKVTSTAGTSAPYFYDKETLKGLEITPQLTPVKNEIRVRTLGSDKKAPSAPVIVPIFEQAELDKSVTGDLPNLNKYMKLIGKKLVPTSGGYPLEWKDGDKWKKGAPKFDTDKGVDKVEIRLAAVGNYAASKTVFMSATAAGALSVCGTKDGTYVTCPALPKPGSITPPDPQEPTIIAKNAIAIGTAAPVKGATITDGTNSVTNATGVVTWSDDDGDSWAATGTIAGETIYKTKYVFTAETDYAFDNTEDFYDGIVVTGSTTVSYEVSTNQKTLTIIVTWPKTAA